MPMISIRKLAQGYVRFLRHHLAASRRIGSVRGFAESVGHQLVFNLTIVVTAAVVLFLLAMIRGVALLLLGR